MSNTQFIIFNNMLTLITPWDDDAINAAIEKVETIDDLGNTEAWLGSMSDDDYPSCKIVNSTDEAENILRQKLIDLGMTENHFSFSIVDEEDIDDFVPDGTVVVETSFVNQDVTTPDNYIEVLYDVMEEKGFSELLELTFEGPVGSTADEVRTVLSEVGMVETEYQSW